MSQDLKSATLSLFTRHVCEIIRSIPKGRVTTYGMIAASAGNSRSARQVGRILHSCSARYDLPWHRVVNREGRITIGDGTGYELQQDLLAQEGVKIGANGRVDLSRFLWAPDSLLNAPDSLDS